MINQTFLSTLLRAINAPFTLMTGREIADGIRVGDPSEFNPTATYLVDNRDGMILAESIEDAGVFGALRMLHSQGRERWTEYTSALN